MYVCVGVIQVLRMVVFAVVLVVVRICGIRAIYQCKCGMLRVRCFCRLLYRCHICGILIVVVVTCVSVTFLTLVLCFRTCFISICICCTCVLMSVTRMSKDFVWIPIVCLAGAYICIRRFSINAGIACMYIRNLPETY